MSDTGREMSITGTLVAIIVFVLGLAATVWFGVYIAVHDFDRQVNVEKRTAEVVGEKALPIAPLKITIRNNPRECVKVESANFDGSDLWIYSRRTCGQFGGYVEIHWRVQAADGTVIESGYDNHEFNQMDVGQRSEWKPYGFKPDPRATEVVLIITGDI